ncbi:MAG: asparagine synthase-related protein [Litorilinea sp.]
MNGFFGVFARRGEPVVREHLARMAEAIPWYGRDDRGNWHAANVGLGNLAQWGTPESRHEHLPLVVEDGRLALTGEFRLDNRAELMAQLQVNAAPDASGKPGAPITDAALILAAYARWGAECGAHLLGDYAFAIWDARAQRMVCVRDAIGPIPFYYALSARGLVFANDIRAVLAHPAVSDRLNPAALARHLAWAQSVAPRETFFEEVTILLPGRVLVVDAARERLSRFWSPEAASAVHFAHPADYYARFNELFDAAVRARLRTVHPVAAHVSGGLDSTAVAAVARRELAARGERLVAGYNWMPTLGPEDDPGGGEYVALAQAAAFLEMPLENVDLTPENLAPVLMQDIAQDGYTDLMYEPLVRAKAQARGVGLLLSGWGGDEVATSGARGYYAELLRRGRIDRIGRLLHARSAKDGKKYTRMARQFWRDAVRPNLPAALIGWRRYTGFPGLAAEMPLTPAMRATIQALDPPFPDLRATSLRAVQSQRLEMGFLQKRMEVWATQGARQGIRYAYPLLDRRLVEFCLGIPGDILIDQRYARGFFRNAQVGRLSEDIRLYDAKFEPTRVIRYLSVLHQALAHWWDQMQQDSAAIAALRVAATPYLEWDRVVAESLNPLIAAGGSLGGSLPNSVPGDVNAGGQVDDYGTNLARYRQLQVALMAAAHS